MIPLPKSLRPVAWAVASGLLLACFFADLSYPALGQSERLPAEARVGGPELPGGGRISCDLPGELHRRNTASMNLGLCVFTSIHHAAVYQNVPQLLEFPKYLIDNRIPGGGYPSKVRDLIPKISKSRGLPPPEYLQVESADLDILRLACKTGRMPSVTYGWSPTRRYGGQRVDHMVSLPHASGDHFVVLDNNYPGSNAYEHMTEKEFLKAYRATTRGDNPRGWAVILLSPGPPPSPLPDGVPVPPSPAPAPAPAPQPVPQPAPAPRP